MHQPKVCVLGAAPDTANLGVSALFESILVGLHDAHPGARVTVFDNGLGARDGVLQTAHGEISYERLGIRHSRRYYRSESLVNMDAASRLRFLPNRGVRRFREADLAVDISGGDSFTDLYGTQRFEAITQQKAIVLRVGTPLALFPQTYGPFSTSEHRSIAADLIRRASFVWARDGDSLGVLESLLGDAFDTRRHRLGVDVAFALPARPPGEPFVPAGSWLDDDSPLMGINISGLLANDTDSARTFGLREPYDPLMTKLVTAILAETEANVLLVPHVVPRADVVESDITAAHRLRSNLPAGLANRVRVLDGVTSASEVKWVIGRCDAFCGTRMHSTIAALSTRTPVTALAYSVKTAGVFETCGQRDRVSDLRTDDAATIIERVLDLWASRKTVERELDVAMPAVIARAREPFRMILDGLLDGGLPTGSGRNAG
jgi:colanic acid/amylovoran biosynthesis protein